MKKSIFLAGLCGMALVAAGCGSDNKTLSYDDTGAEIGKICDQVDFTGLNGKPAHDAPVLAKIVPDFEQAIQDVRDLDVDGQLTDTRDQFADNADQQVVLIKQAQTSAEQGDTKAYHKTIDKVRPLGKESDLMASKLGATACIDN